MKKAEREQLKSLIANGWDARRALAAEERAARLRASREAPKKAQPKPRRRKKAMPKPHDPSKPWTPPEVAAAVDAELQRGSPRSGPYRQGMIDVLVRQLIGPQLPVTRYKPGTTSADAYFSGNERGWMLWRTITAVGPA